MVEVWGCCSRPTHPREELEEIADGRVPAVGLNPLCAAGRRGSELVQSPVAQGEGVASPGRSVKQISQRRLPSSSRFSHPMSCACNALLKRRGQAADGLERSSAYLAVYQLADHLLDRQRHAVNPQRLQREGDNDWSRARV